MADQWAINDLVGRVLPFHRGGGRGFSEGRELTRSRASVRGSGGRLGFGDALDRWFDQTVELCREERHRVDSLFEELSSLREFERSALIRRDPRFHSWVLAARMLDESRELSLDRPRSGERLARLTLDLLHRLDPEIYGERLIRDLEGRAWAVLGNALRLAADLDGADRAFEQGLRCLADSFDPFERAELLALLGSLRRDQRRFDEALETFDRAQKLYEEIRETRRIPRILTKKGLLWLERAEPERAVEFFVEAQRRLLPGDDFRTELAVHHNLCWCYVHMGQYPRACRIFRDNQSLYSRADDSWTRLRVRWLEGNLEAGTGNEVRAVAVLSEVRDALAKKGQDYDAAFVSLDLAVLYARQQRFPELRRLSREMASLFTARHIHRGALLALAFFRQAAERETLTAETVRGLAAYVKKSRFDAGRELKLE